MSKELSREEILEQIAALAFGNSVDAAKLAFLKGEGHLAALDGLDLRTLSGLHVSGNGAVELKFVDRVKLLELLLAALECRDAAAEGGAAQLIGAIHTAAAHLSPEETPPEAEAEEAWS